MKKVTVIFEDDDLYTAVKVQAVRLGRSLKAVVAEALEGWLEAREEEEDIEAYRQGMAEYGEKGGIPWEEVKGQLEAIAAEREKRATARGGDG